MGKNTDLITREGLQAFADQCKQKFTLTDVLTKDADESYILLTYTNNEYTSFVLVITGSGNLEKSLSLYSVVTINDTNGTVINSGSAKITDASFSVTSSLIVLNITLNDSAALTNVTTQCLASKNSSATAEVLHCTAKEASSSKYASYDNACIIVTPTASTGNINFYIKKDAKESESYELDKSFNLIEKASKLSHNVKFEITSVEDDIPTSGYDLSGDTVKIYSKEVSGGGFLGSGFSGTNLRTVSVADGLVVGGSTDVVKASSTQIGGIKLGYTRKDSNFPVQLDNENRAYVELPSAIFSYKGPVASFDSLPTDATVGDVYTVTSGTDQTDTGSEYVYVEKDGKNYWEYLGQKFSFTQERVDWEATDGVTSILNKPTIPKVSFVQYTINEQNKETPITLGEVELNNTNEAQENTVLFYNSTEDEVTLTLDTSITWINMGGLEITIPAGKYAEFVFTYWPLVTKDGETLQYIVTYNGAVQQ